MSTSSFHRPKPQTAAAATKPTASSKSTTPFPQNPLSGKENPPRGASRPRASSVPKPNPTINLIPNIDKASEVRPRRSTSSVPRGRCPSPSEYMKNSVNKKIDQKGSFGNAKKLVDSKKLGFRGVRNVDGIDLVDKGRDLEKMDKKGSFGKDKKFVDSKLGSDSVGRIDLGDKGRVLEKVKVRTLEKRVNLLNIDVDSRVKNRVSQSTGLRSGNEMIYSVGKKNVDLVEKDLVFDEVRVREERVNLLDLEEVRLNDDVDSRVENRVSQSTGLRCMNESIEDEMIYSVGNKNVDLVEKDGVFEEVKVRESSKGKDGITSAKRYPSKLHEKLAFLEGKVKKIALDIKQTKEMLELTNPDSSEVVLFDIQEKILGIEKEMGHVPIEEKNKDTENSEGASHENSSSRLIACQNNDDFLLTANEKLEEFDEQENTSKMVIEEENENSCAYMLRDIGHKISTGGWFVSEGEAVLLAHDDGSCSYYDVTNCEGKAEYKPPAGISSNMWRDCWIVRAPSADGCAGKYVIAASAGNSIEAGFCSWDFYTKHVRAFHVEGSTSLEHQQWFYRPCGPLIVSTASCQRSVKVYDVRDGDHVMRWELQKPVATMEYSSPLQWRNKGKVVVAEAENISLWDVSSLRAQPLLSVSSCNRKISALHVNNTDAEQGGGVRQRVSSSEVEGNDGVFCTSDSINVIDFRQPSGIGLKIPKLGVDVQSAFSRGDSVLLGCTSLKSSGKRQSSSEIQQFSLRKQRLLSTYVLPDSNAHSHHKAITQVWGNSNLVMGVSGLGLSIFDSLKDEGLLPYTMNSSMTSDVKEVVGSDDLYSPSFDYLASRVLLISRDRPAQCRYVID